MANELTASVWRDDAVTPLNYDDVAHVVRSVRRARRRVVAFAWHLTADQLRQLRLGITAWSSSVVGRYKTFDARIVKAIDAALGEPDARFAIREPQNGVVDCTVTCARSGDDYRLEGHAPFDLVFAYALVGADGGSAAVHLDDATRAALADGVRALGWDVVRMREPRLRPARNALFGFPLAHGTDDIPRSQEPPVDVSVEFRGPFSAAGAPGVPQLFAEPLAQRIGIYLWSYAVDGVEHVAYVGQTRRGFATRIEEHLSALLSGRYEIPDLDATLRGEARARWRPDGDPAARWSRFLGEYGQLAPAIHGVLGSLRFHVAPIEGDERLFDRIEGALGRYYRTDAPASARRLFDARIRVPAAVPGDRPLRLVLTSDVEIAALPDELLA
jgi:hypothetical protein